jgi:hypothetical protein
MASRAEDDLVRVLLVALRALEVNIPPEGTLESSHSYAVYSKYLDIDDIKSLPRDAVGLLAELINQGYIGITFSQAPNDKEPLEQWLSRVTAA